jgi:hypothetical protein
MTILKTIISISSFTSLLICHFCIYQLKGKINRYAIWNLFIVHFIANNIEEGYGKLRSK